MAIRDDVYILPNVSGPTEVISIDATRCIGCNACANICRTQTIIPSPEKGQPPVMVYPDECWFCACCVEVCPTGAIEMRHPIARRLMFKRKETGEVYRIGQKNPPPKSYFKAPYGMLSDSGKTHEVWAALSSSSKYVTAYFTPDACGKIAERLGETDEPAGKVLAAARLIGFDAAYLYDGEISDAETGANAYTVLVTVDGNADSTEPDAVLKAGDFVNIFHRACVSMYTAVQVWQGLPDDNNDQK